MTDAVYPKFRWFILLSYVIVTAATSLSMIAPAPMVPEMAKTMGIDLGEATAAAMMTFNLFMGVFAFVGGFFLDKVGVFRMWIICLVIIGSGSLLMPVIGNSIPGLVACRILHAAGTGPIMASIAMVSARYFKYKERTYVAAFQGVAVSFGIAIGLMFSPKMLSIVGDWKPALAWTAIFPALGIIFGLIVLMGPKPPAVQSAGPATDDTVLFSPDFKKALCYITVYLLALMGLIDSWCQQTYNAMMPGLYAAPPPVGLGFGAMGSVKLTWASFAMMAGALAAPVVTENIFKGNPKPTVFIGLGIAGAMILTVQKLTPQTGDLILIGVPCLVLFFSSFVNPTIFGYVAKHYPSGVAGRLGGFIMFFFVFGATFGQGISSYLLSKTGFYWKPMLLLAVVTFIGAIVVLFLRPPKGFEALNLDGSKKSPAN